MPVSKPRRQLSRGACHLCGKEFSKNKITAHLDQCWADLTAKEKHDKRTLAPTLFFRLLVEARDDPKYWLHVDVRADSTLEDLDDFLRRTWLECCGHLSAFTIGEERYCWEPPGGFGDDVSVETLGGVFGTPREIRMDITLADTLAPGLLFEYEYDFGTTTELKLRVLSEHEEPTRRKNLRVLARNESPFNPCLECGQPADWIGTYGDSSVTRTICDACTEKKGFGDAQLLPLVNSPRTGVCGYTGVLED